MTCLPLGSAAFSLFCWNRFLEDDSVSPGGGFEINIYQILGTLAVPGLFIALYQMPDFMVLSHHQPGLSVDWAIRLNRLFFPAYSFAVAGFATVFEWDVLFPDRRDFLVLTPFPIRLRELLGARLAALGIFVSALVLAVNFFPTLMVPVFSSAIPQVAAAGLIRLCAAQIAAAGGASLFAFFAVAAVQGILISLITPRLFRRLSPAIQMCGMSLMVLSLLTYPIYSMLLRTATRTHPQWLFLFPPIWFTGLYDVLLPGSDPLFVALGHFALKASGVAIALVALSWTLGFRRHYRRTLESEDTAFHVFRLGLPSAWIRSPEERAIFDFSGRTLARSTKHRLFLATYLSAGIAFGLLAAVVVREGRIGVSRDGLRALPFFVAFFAISGLRAAFQFPAELPANWIFRITEAAWVRISRRATRKRVLVSALLPVMLLSLPLENGLWGWRFAALHFAIQFAAGTALAEALFWTFDKVPFACAYFPGRANLALLLVIYLYGFITWSFWMSDWEAAMDESATLTIRFFALTAMGLWICWRRTPTAEALRFDSGEPELQTLNLS